MTHEQGGAAQDRQPSDEFVKQVAEQLVENELHLGSREAVREEALKKAEIDVKRTYKDPADVDSIVARLTKEVIRLVDTDSEWKRLQEKVSTSQVSTARADPRDGNARHVHRLNVNFSEQAYQTLDWLAKRTGKSMSETLRDAIALKQWFEATRAEGGHVLVERPDGQIREVISV
jgi:hypothetical protein